MNATRRGVKSRAAVRTRWNRESGMTLVFTLGFLCVMMLIMLTLALVARQERRAASMSADMISGRLIAQSALDNAVASLRKGAVGRVFPGDAFYSPGSSNAWSGRRYVGSADKGGDEGIEAALAVEFSGSRFTPESVLRSSSGWIPVRSRQSMIEDGQPVERDVLLGRYAYVIIDESGKLDPGAVVSSYQDEDSKERVGRSPTEIALSSAGIPHADDFRPAKVTSGSAGEMPEGARWFSMSHIARAIDPSDNDMGKFVQRLHPFSYDRELYWRDRNANGTWDEGEDEERLDLVGALSVVDMYDAFVGQDKESGDDDCAWLKGVDKDGWFQQWRQYAGLSTEAARRIVAAQVAANILDYSDGNSSPVQVYVDSSGNAHEGNYSGDFNLRGVDRTWGISEVAVRIQADQYEEQDGETGGGSNDDTYCVLGDININPNNSPHMEFYVTKLDGSQITRDDLHAWGPDWQGTVNWIHVKPKGNGNQNGLTVDGEVFPLRNAYTYDIYADSMDVHIYNDRRHANGRAMGHWWIAVNACDCNIVINDKGYHGGNESNVNFEITNGTVVTQERCRAYVTVLGSAMSYGGQYDMPVTARVEVSGETHEPWGDWGLPLDGNLNDGGNPREFQMPDTYEPGTAIAVSSRSWYKKKSSYSGTSNSHWKVYRTVDSTPANYRVHVLRNGDPVPQVQGYLNQAAISYYVASYVHDGRITLTSNQAIYLFEHTNDMDGPSADYQDLVALVTLEEVDEAPAGDGDESSWENYPMTIWAVDDGSSKLYFYEIGESGATANLEGSLTGISGNKDIEAFTIDANGVMYLMNNVGTSKLYKIVPEQLDRNGSTPVEAVYIGDTGLTGGSDYEITSLQFVEGILYGIGKESERVYQISIETGAVTEVARLRVPGSFRCDGLTLGADGVVYLTKTESTTSELWRFESFPDGGVEYVCTIAGSGAVEALTAHPNGLLYAADSSRWYRIDPVAKTTEVETTISTGIQGMDFYYHGEYERIVLGGGIQGPSEDDPDPEVGHGKAMRYRVGVRAELLHPFLEDAQDSEAPGSLKMTYTIEVTTATGQVSEVTRTMSIPVDRASNVDGATLLYSSDYADDEWIEIPEAFDYEVVPPQNWYTVTKFQIDRIELRDGANNVTDTVPAGPDYFCNWAHPAVSYADESFYVSARAKDPMMNDRSEKAPDFGVFWDAYPGTSSLGVGELENVNDIGSLTYGTYETAPYSKVRVKNGVFGRIGELGRVHSFMPMRSLRFWSASSSDVDGNDAALMDMFKIGSAGETRGKVNINTTNANVLKALFDGATNVDPTAAAEAVLSARDDGEVFTNVGQVFAAVPGLSGSDPSEDEAEEAAIARIAELITVRQNYFTIVACAQAIRDVAGKSYKTYSDGSTPTLQERTASYFFDEDGNGSPNGLDVVRNADGKIVKYVDRILAEQKLVAVVYRDAFSNKMRIERVEYIGD